MSIARSGCAHAGRIFALVGFILGGSAGVASAQYDDWQPGASYLQPQALPAGESQAEDRDPLLRLAAYEPLCGESHCPSCSACGERHACGECDECCEASCDRGAECCDPRAFYLALSGGWASREIVRELGDPATFLTFHDGFHINFALGRKFDWGRIEAEISRFNNRVRLSGYGDPVLGDFVGPSPGNLNLTAYMFNAYHDFDIEGWRVDPYLGAGIGVCQSEINGLLPSYFEGPPLNLDDQAVNCTSDYQFAWQVRGGFNYDWSERTTLYFGYRYFRVEDLTFSAFPFGTFNPNGGREHALEWGLRVAF